MRELILAMSALGAMFLFMHEFDAFHRGEWRMFKFIRTLKDETQYAVFLLAHIPLTLFMFYYLLTILMFSDRALWIAVNGLCVAHFILHLAARKWTSNVFHSPFSFVFIAGAAVAGVTNLCLIGYY